MRARGPERGFTLAALIIFLTAASVLLAVGVPAYQMQMQREMEEELIFRAQEYVRAILKYQRQNGIYPPDLDALFDTNGIRYLRREYTDPFTGAPFRLLTWNGDGTIEGSSIYDDLMDGGGMFQGMDGQAFGEPSSSQMPTASIGTTAVTAFPSMQSVPGTAGSGGGGNQDGDAGDRRQTGGGSSSGNFAPIPNSGPGVFGSGGGGSPFQGGGGDGFGGGLPTSGGATFGSNTGSAFGNTANFGQAMTGGGSSFGGGLPGGGGGFGSNAGGAFGGTAGFGPATAGGESGFGGAAGGGGFSGGFPSGGGGGFPTSGNSGFASNSVFGGTANFGQAITGANSAQTQPALNLSATTTRDRDRARSEAFSTFEEFSSFNQNDQEDGGGGSGNQPDFGAGGIVGVAPDLEGPSLKVYNERETYQEWEFIAIPGYGTVPMPVQQIEDDGLGDGQMQMFQMNSND